MTSETPHQFEITGVGLGVCKNCGQIETRPIWPPFCSPAPRQEGQIEVKNAEISPERAKKLLNEALACYVSVWMQQDEEEGQEARYNAVKVKEYYDALEAPLSTVTEERDQLKEKVRIAEENLYQATGYCVVCGKLSYCEHKGTQSLPTRQIPPAK